MEICSTSQFWFSRARPTPNYRRWSHPGPKNGLKCEIWDFHILGPYWVLMWQTFLLLLLIEYSSSGPVYLRNLYCTSGTRRKADAGSCAKHSSKNINAYGGNCWVLRSGSVWVIAPSPGHHSRWKFNSLAHFYFLYVTRNIFFAIDSWNLSNIKHINF